MAQSRLLPVGPFGRAALGGVAWCIGGVRTAARGCLRLGFWIERLALRVLMPLRWPLAAGLLGVALWRARGSVAALELGARYPDFAPAPPAGQAWGQAAGMYLLPALLAAAVLLIGLPLLRRRRRVAPTASGPAVPAGDSLLDFVISGVRRVTV